MVDFVLGNLRFNWTGPWASNTAYLKNDVVSYGGRSFVALHNHISSGNSDDGFYSDKDVDGNWQMMTDGVHYRGSWTANTFYKDNDIVSVGADMYICNTQHESGQYWPNTSVNFVPFVAGGYESKGVYSNTEYYFINDIVTYGGDTFISTQEAQNVEPTDANTWTKILEGYNFRGEFTSNTRYYPGDIVLQGGYSYRANVVSFNTQPEATNTDSWLLVGAGFKWRGAWDANTTYNLGETVRHNAASWVSMSDMNVAEEPTADSNTYWDLVVNDANTAVGTLTTTGDMLYRSNTGVTRLPIGSNNQVLVSDGTVPYWATPIAGSPPFLASEGPDNIGAVYTAVNRADNQMGFYSSGPWTTFNAYQIGSSSSTSIQAFNMASGDGYTNGGSNIKYSGSNPGNNERQLVWATANRVGSSYRPVHEPNDSSPSNYTPLSFMLMPVRNMTGSGITRTIYWAFSNYWSSGYEGSSLGVYVPNSTTYSGTSSGSWSNYISATSGYNAVTNGLSASVYFPPNKTVLIMTCASAYYYTQSYNYTYGQYSSSCYDTNMFYNLNNWLYDTSLVVDMRMLGTLAYSNFARIGAYTSDNAYLAYTTAATIYGDR